MVLPTAGETGWATKLNDHINGLPQPGHNHPAGAQQFRSGLYYGPWRTHGGIYDTFALVAGTLYANPLYVGEETVFNQIVITLTNAGSAGSVVRLGIYKSERLVPTTLIVDGGAVSSATSGVKSVTINTTLSPGLYWVVAVTDSTVSQCRAVTAAIQDHFLKFGQSVNDWYDGNVSDCWRMTGYVAANPLPATASLTGLAAGSGVGRDAVNINVRAA
ncbi:MAG TPA: hypothetical protein VGD26_09720 [Chitinophagaceae bacterium]